MRGIVCRACLGGRRTPRSVRCCVYNPNPVDGTIRGVLSSLNIPSGGLVFSGFNKWSFKSRRGEGYFQIIQGRFFFVFISLFGGIRGAVGNLGSVLSELGVRRLGPVRRTSIRTFSGNNRSLVLLSPANSNGALTFLLPLINDLGTSIGKIRTIILIPSHRLTLRVRRIFGTVKARFGTVDYCNKHPTVRRRHAVGKVRPTIVVNAPNHVGSRLSGRGFSTDAIGLLIVSRFSGYLRFNFRRRVTAIVKRLPSLGQHFLASTASTRRVPRFAKLGHAVGLSFLAGSIRRSHLQLVGIISPTGSGVRALCGLLYALKDDSDVIFYGRESTISHIDTLLARGKISGRHFRKNVRRPSQRQTLCGFHGNDYPILISASLTTHKLSVPRIRRVVRCRLPIGRRTFARHGNHATH